ncbi:aspartyl/asparaginyl beta-hydroxylase domain-containing protein [Flavobacterium sp. 3HN19-14]|uniref:aspartyl/asparaginyl beta-hydroxylase domain-containing protein n=1 Tax=Flavobacterium sp. 3HN19-14 TaxID=3448133 RepID=UPI003EDEFA60
MDNLIRSIKFPITFDVSKLQNDLDKIIGGNWIDHYNTFVYSGKWTSIALMSKTGKSDVINAHLEMNEELVPTEILNICSYFQEILDGFLFEKTAVRLLKLDIGAVVNPHKDFCLGYEDGYFRLHIPIITNSEVEFILDDKRIIMNEGECWYIDANFTHSVANRGKQDRIHLVIDGVRNDWSDAMFYKEAARERFIKQERVIAEPQTEQIIAELLRMNTPAAQNILKDLGYFSKK